MIESFPADCGQRFGEFDCDGVGPVEAFRIEIVDSICGVVGCYFLGDHNVAAVAGNVVACSFVSGADGCCQVCMVEVIDQPVDVDHVNFSAGIRTGIVGSAGNGLNLGELVPVVAHHIFICGHGALRNVESGVAVDDVIESAAIDVWRHSGVTSN